MRLLTSSLARSIVFALSVVLLLSLAVGLGINSFFVDQYRTNLIDQRVVADQLLLQSMRDDFQRYRSVAQLLSTERHIRAINQAGEWYNPIFDYAEFLDDLSLVERVSDAPIGVVLYMLGRERVLSVEGNLRKISIAAATTSEYPDLTEDRIDTWRFFTSDESEAPDSLRYLTSDIGRISPRSLCVEIRLDLARYRERYAQLWSVREGYLCIVDSEGVVDTIPSGVPQSLLGSVLERHDPLSIAGTRGVVDDNRRRWHFVVEGDVATGMLFATLIPSDLILRPLLRARLLVFAVFGVSLAIAAAVALRVIRRLVIPLNRFVGSLREFGSGDLRYQAKEDDAGELEAMYRTFNHMVHRINTLIDENYGKELHSRGLQLKFLQSQINPHFLHNCMNFIYQMSFDIAPPAVAEMALHLSRYYRYMMDWSDDDASLADELEHARVYLEIHRLRLGSRLRYELDADDEACDLSISVPRLILQPIVENAVIHGVEETEEDAWIGLCARAEDGFVLVEVRNGPCDIDDEVLELMKSRLSTCPPAERTHALGNVHGRLLLRFGAAATLDVRLEQRTLVFTVRFPQQIAEDIGRLEK